MRPIPSLRSFLPGNAPGRLVSCHLRAPCRYLFTASVSRACSHRNLISGKQAVLYINLGVFMLWKHN